VSETVPLEPNHVYIIPPNANLDAIDTHLRLSELEQRRYDRAPIDHFFRTLAKTHDGESIGIILTGTGSDGTLGLRAIKECGGLTVVQDPAKAEYDGMPRSAIATGLIDLILPVEQIPQAILDFARTEPDVPVLSDEAQLESETRRLVQRVHAQLRTQTGRDFSRYKPPTIMRRIQRRMQMRRIGELAAYADLLRKDADEARRLADDMLITVTNFFRDVEVFQMLEQNVIPRLFDGEGDDAGIRVWTAGCARGGSVFTGHPAARRGRAP
jgi:two-component system, chemotaxis family, CheB/CheR fusion protein